MKTIFWNVDTQYDFMRDDESFNGALPVLGARDIERNLEKLTRLAEDQSYQVINTADWHTPESREIRQGEFPPHCIQGTRGAEYIPATAPKDAHVIDWQDQSIDAESVNSNRNIIIYKDEFDAFHKTGSPHIAQVLDIINPDKVIVYGVATNVCVDYAVMGNLEQGREVYVVIDAIKELPKEVPVPTLDETLTKWEKAGAKFVTTNEIIIEEAGK